MDYQEFYDKLIPFFSRDEIKRLNQYAYDSAFDAIREPDETWEEQNDGDFVNQDEYLYFAGREFVCSLMYDLTSSDDPNEYALEFGKTFGFYISPETAAALLDQFEIEW